ncbi:unnamed protein product [Heterosigma akashiwo]|uniref:Uncharacterized protein n=1 Tax=Heterosigma akashiwo TaxID=2829 RepID=A0A6V1VH36_HETAK|mmetsp:Transcript_27091/g.46586  ORF Transcript_27091/g.46586 Transcript_27091/m.46586 type:complete len:171 (+) Transcript_27091:33-545(+)
MMYSEQNQGYPPPPPENPEYSSPNSNNSNWNALAQQAAVAYVVDTHSSFPVHQQNFAEQSPLIAPSQLDDISFWQLAFAPPPLSPDREKMALIFLIVQVFFAGWGAILDGVFRRSWKLLVVGLCQMISAGVLIGWIWSISWGAYLWIKTKKAKEEAEAQEWSSSALEQRF